MKMLILFVPDEDESPRLSAAWMQASLVLDVKPDGTYVAEKDRLDQTGLAFAEDALGPVVARRARAAEKAFAAEAKAALAAAMSEHR